MAVLAAGDDNGNIKVCNVQNPQAPAVLYTLETSNVGLPATVSAQIGRMASAYANGDSIAIWNPTNGTLLKQIRPLPDAPQLSGSTVVLSRDTLLVSSAIEGNELGVWNVLSGNQQYTLQGSTAQLNDSAFEFASSVIAAGSDDNNVYLWNLAAVGPPQALAGHTAPVYAVRFCNAPQTTLASGSGDASIRLWNTAAGTTLQTLNSHAMAVLSLDFSFNGTLLASGSADRTVKTWNVANGTLANTFVGHTAPVDAVAFSPDASMLASGGGDQTIRLWNPQNPQAGPLAVLENDSGISALAFIPLVGADGG